MAGLKLSKLNKIYPNGVCAVKDFDLTVGDKEFIVIVGPSGCGKSTTLRMIAGLEDITSGELYINGVLSNKTKPHKRGVAMVFQDNALFPHMTVYENMAFGLRVKKHNKADIDKKVRAAAEKLGLTKYLFSMPHTLSGGQDRRVALGRAMVLEPEIFLFDEPLSNLDVQLRTSMRGEILKLYNELDATFVYVTHDQAEAMTMGTRIIVMNDGCIKQIATPAELYNAPANKFVAGFIGSPQMNFLNVSFTADGDTPVLNIAGEKCAVSSIKKSGNIIGLRPEHIYLQNKPNTVKLSCRVERTEYLGSDCFIYGILPSGESIVVKAPPETKPNVEIPVYADLEKIHVFTE